MSNKIIELLSHGDLNEQWQIKLNTTLVGKIDVTIFWLWFVENYPKGKISISDTPEFWKKFK
jgi:hypothetical protein